MQAMYSSRHRHATRGGVMTPEQAGCVHEYLSHDESHCERCGMGSSSIITAQRTHIRDLEAQAINADMGDAILDEIAGTLKELGCSHGPDAHLSTPPMFYREWMLCVMGSAIRSATRDLEAQVREARVAFCEFHDMARNMARYLSTDGICHWIASEEFGAATPPSPEVK